MAKFKGADFLSIMETQFTEEERMVRDSVREWVEDRVIPVVDRCYQEDLFPLEWKDELASLGALGPGLAEYGGLELSHVCRGLIYRELERGDSGLRSFASVMNSLVMFPIRAYGTKAQQEKWLPGMIRGEKVGCFGLTEPDFGSNPGGMLTRAEKVADGWLLNGTKRWITNGSISDVAIVFAKTAEGIRGFLVPKETPGFSAPVIRQKWSLRASVTSELIMEDCLVAEDAILPGTSIGLKAPLTCLSEARYGIAWGAVGVMEACYEEAFDYVMTRRQFEDKPLASHQLVQQRLSSMLTETVKSELLILQVGRLKDLGLVNHAHISMAKRNNCEVALDIARTARDMLGASGITHEYHCGRHMMNMESVKTYEGAHDVHHLILGDYITGIPAYS
jgi:glutaryl-CoA dehydrogenase